MRCRFRVSVKIRDFSAKTEGDIGLARLRSDFRKFNKRIIARTVEILSRSLVSDMEDGLKSLVNFYEQILKNSCRLALEKSFWHSVWHSVCKIVARFCIFFSICKNQFLKKFECVRVLSNSTYALSVLFLAKNFNSSKRYVL